jgi:hypothetical protein
MVGKAYNWQLPETPSQGALPKIPDIVGAYYRYAFIDHGAQFRVYKISSLDGISTGRVVKVPLDFDETQLAIGPHLQRLGLTPKQIDRRIHQLLIHKQQLPTLVQGVYAADKQLMRLFGDIKIIPVLAAVPKHEPDYFMPLYFTQDCVTPMSIYLHRFRLAYLPPRRLQTPDITAIRQLLRAVINTHYTLWKYGIFEMSLKIENMGVRTDGKHLELILLDLGEYTTSFEEALSIIKEQRWLNSLNTNKTDHLFVPTVLHKLYIEMLGNAFTEAALKAHWQTRLQRIQRRQEWHLRMKEVLSFNSQAGVTAWIKRQTLSTNLHRDIPLSRIDQLSIPRNELNFLLMDRQVNRTPETVVNALERAERHAFKDHTGAPLSQTLFRHSLPSDNLPL